LCGGDKLRKRITVLTSLVLTFVLAIVGIFSINYSNSGNNQLVRNVELNNNSLVDDNYFNAFDSYDLIVEDNKSTFDGFITINLAELAEIDNVASSDILNDASLKFSSTFDYDTGTSTLNVYVIDENEEVTIIDTIYGVALLAETGEVDVLFDFDGELIFLSELRDIGVLDNVGWFTNLVKKAVNKVATEVKNTATAVVKVLSTQNGAIGTVCTLAACAVVGAACSFIPGGQIVTSICAGIAGSVIGKVGFDLTAKAAQQQNSSITNEDISRYGTVGAIAGSVVSVASCNAMTAWRVKHSVKKFDSYDAFKAEYGNASECSVKYGNAGDNGTYEWHHIVEQNQIGKNGVVAQDIYNTKNTISLGYDTHRQVSGIYRTKIGNLPNKNISGLTDLFKNADPTLSVQNYMTSLSFDKQYEIGIQVLRLLGVKI
jgi:hypothetical protein